jgi:uncharacterized protein
VNASRPRPSASPLTEPFWEAARRHELVRPVCRACGKSFFTPQIACPHCTSEEWDYRVSSGRGVVYSATLVHRAPFDGFDVPYELAIIDLAEGWSMLGNIAGDGTPTSIGTPVEVDWIAIGDGVELPVFRVRAS